MIIIGKVWNIPGGFSSVSVTKLNPPAFLLLSVFCNIKQWFTTNIRNRNDKCAYLDKYTILI